MPIELLNYSFLYPIVGIYRLFNDKLILNSLFIKTKPILIKTFLWLIPFLIISLPLTKLYLTLLLKLTPFNFISNSKRVHNFTTLTLILSQISFILEFRLKKVLKQFRKESFQLTLNSRNKPIEFWLPYIEEWSIPPLLRANRNLIRINSNSNKFLNPIFKYFIIKILLQPLSFIPFLKLFIGSALNSFNLATKLHEPYFKLKSLTPLEKSLFLTENANQYYQFGFISSLLERIPIIGILFSISNQIGSAMWCFDLEKRQHLFKEGKGGKGKVYISSTSTFEGREVEEGEEGIGAFPRKKGPVLISRQGLDILGLEKEKEN